MEITTKNGNKITIDDDGAMKIDGQLVAMIHGNRMDIYHDAIQRRYQREELEDCAYTIQLKDIKKVVS